MTPRHPPVLIVDDEPIIGSVIERELSDRSAPEVTTNGAEALAWLRDGRSYALIFCDLYLRGVSGFEILEWIRRERPELLTRLVFITGRVWSHDEEQEFTKLGVRLLAKPFGSAELHAVVGDDLPPPTTRSGRW